MRTKKKKRFNRYLKRVYLFDSGVCVCTCVFSVVLRHIRFISHEIELSVLIDWPTESNNKTNNPNALLTFNIFCRHQAEK